MTLTSDSCGGPNPLVSLADRYRSTARADVFYGNHSSSSSHYIADLLSQVKQQPSAGNSLVTDALQIDLTTPLKRTQKRQYKNSLNKSFSEFSLHQPPLQTKSLQLQQWRPHQRNSSAHNNETKQKLHNQRFEEWVKRYHPEVLLNLKTSSIIDVELSHDLAEEWLKDFNLNDVLNVSSLTEAENIVEEWIREFQLGQQISSDKRLSFADKVSLERGNEKEYEYLTLGEHGVQEIEEGVEMIKQGDLLSAISIFEKIVREDESCGEAWYYLGLCHQQSENEEQAINAFKNVGVEDVCYPSTLLGLAASYLNENKHNSATLCLTSWLQRSHPHLISDTTTRSGTVLRAALLSIPRTEHNDVEIQTGLGILSCIQDEPHIAAEHFRAAVAISPLDFMLWNRLGATLANSDQNTASVEAYRRALSLSPGYIRARYNLGIACLNLRANREGIEHFLQCLKQQDSLAVWKALRQALTLGQHYDLLEAVDTHSLLPILRYFGMD